MFRDDRDDGKMKKIAEQKLQAFSIGAMGMRPLSRRELEEQKKKEEEEAAAHVFQEFVETFQEAPSKTSKVWVKAGTYDAGSRKEDNSERGKIYKPQSRLSDKPTSLERAQEYVRLLATKPDKPVKKKDKDKKKSNLELFKEELRQIQEEREERHKYKGALKGVLTDSSDLSNSMQDEPPGSFFWDLTTTNIYIKHLHRKVTEQQLMEIFGKFGPLASVKIMWPRSEEENARRRNCGFVAFMSRRDGERAYRTLNGKEILECEVKLRWAKAVTIPAHPIYIPPTMQQPNLLAPPPASGLPFNAQAPRHLASKIPRLRPGESYPSDPQEKELFDKILSQSVVKVVIPTQRAVLTKIHRMVEFVIREGPMFEAMIMNDAINHPWYRFLFENQSPAHVYYRWKLFSLLQGDSVHHWNTNEFRMFKGGSIWRPPAINVYTQGMPDELINEEEIDETKGTLSKTQRERLEELIRQLSPERWSIGQAMVFCMEHAEAADEISDCIAESLSMATTTAHKKIARMYLVSDILHNCGAKLVNASYYRRAMEARLCQIMRDLHTTWKQLEGPLQSEGFKTRVLAVLSAWEDWNIYPSEFIRKLGNLLNGIEEPERPMADMDEMREAGDASFDGDADGNDDEAETEAEEGGPLDGAALLKAAQGLQMRSGNCSIPIPPSLPKQDIDNYDIDGIPMDDDIDGIPFEDSSPQASTPMSSLLKSAPGFVPSRWESVEPGIVEAGAVTSQRWNHLQRETSPLTVPSTPPPPPAPSYRESIITENDSSEVSDERRQLLRNVEVRAMQYQDELEAGQRQLKPGWTVHQQVTHYRRKLIKKAEREAKEKEEAVVDSPERERAFDKKSHRERERESRAARSGSSEDGYNTSNSSSRKSKKSRDISISPPPKRSRHRSRSPIRSSRSSRPSSSRRNSPSPPPPPSPPSISRRRDLLSSSSSSRKHKLKHKY